MNLAVPSLLALSAAAAWSPQITTAGTGFSANITYPAANTATLFVEYYDPGRPKNINFSAGYFPTGGGSWQSLVNTWIYTDNQSMTYSSITSPPVATAAASASDGGSGTAYASVTWY
jgi:hypothetical protein